MPEARRPRGSIVERLRAFVPASASLAPAAGPAGSAAALPPDAALALPALQRVLYGKFQEADEELAQLLLSSALTSSPARSLVQATHALCQMLWSHDARAALQALAAPLRDADLGTLLLIHGIALIRARTARRWPAIVASIGMLPRSAR